VNLTVSGDQLQAVRFVDDAVAILERIRGERGADREPDLDLEYRMGLAYSNASDVYQADTRPGSIEKSIDLRLKSVGVNERLVSATSGMNASYVRALFGERNNLCGQYGDLNDFVRALELCRAAQPLLKSLQSDRNNAQIELDATQLHFNLGRALMGTGNWEEAASEFEANVRTLQVIAGQSSSLQVEYMLAASEGAMGGIEEHHAANTRASRSERLLHWKRAAGWYEKAMPRFDHVASKLSLTDADMVLVRSAAAGLARSRVEAGESEKRH
jgi:tetratricopeptide (TPR) repeat protein